MSERKLSYEELLKFQPNRYPFLMIDVVTDVSPGKYAKGFKNLTMNEWYFPKHFPGHPNMPGALQLEALAQMLTVAITSQEGLEGSVTHALQHTVRFRKEVIPVIVYGSFKTLIFLKPKLAKKSFKDLSVNL